MRKRPHRAWIIAGGLALAFILNSCTPNPVPADVEERSNLVDAVEEGEKDPFVVSFTMPAVYEPQSTKTVSVAMEYSGDEPVTALALRLLLPPEWQYAGMAGDLRPAIEPAAASRGELTFVWINTPEFPATVECLLDTPEGGGAVALSAQAVYRGLGEEVQSPVAKMELQAGT